jgi:hypothetical protein
MNLALDRAAFFIRDFELQSGDLPRRLVEPPDATAD